MRRHGIGILGVAVLFLCVAASSEAVPTSESITDRAGRVISVTRPYQRIISLYGAHTENLFALGLSSCIIGVSRHEVYPPDALEKPSFSYHDGPEKFIAASPDLVLVRPMIDRGYGRLMKQLESSGITVVSLQPSTVEEMYDYWKTLGVLTGRSERADQMVAEFNHGVKEIKKRVAGIGVRKRVYFEAIHRQMKTFSPDSMTIFALTTAGGINVADDAIASRGTNIGIYGKERILSKADSIDVFLVQSGRMNTATVDTIRNEPGFHIIKAVKNGAIYQVDEMLVSRPTLRLLDGIRVIGSRLYPELFGTPVAGVNHP